MTLPPRIRLVLASALMLFVELALIRWTSSNNLYLVHLTNFVLLASFLGIGLGFLRGGRGRDLFPLAPASSLALLVAFVLAFPVRTGTTSSGGWALVGGFGMAPLPRWLSLTVIFLLTVAALGTVAQEVARTFARFAPLEAYRLDIGRLACSASSPSPGCRSSGCRRSAGRCWPRAVRRAPRDSGAVVALAARGRHRGDGRRAGRSSRSSGRTSGRRTTRSAPRRHPAATSASTSTTPRCRPPPRSSQITKDSPVLPLPLHVCRRRTTTCSSSVRARATTSRSP